MYANTFFINVHTIEYLIMKNSNYIKLFILFQLVFICNLSFSKSNYSPRQLKRETKITLDYLTQKYRSCGNMPTGELMIKIALEFLDKPYVGNTLEVYKSEKTILNLSQFDCTTFAENCLAISRIIKSERKKQNLQSFKKELTKIRYRNGNRNGYTSRLHYFSDWINDNEQKNIVMNISNQLGAFKFNNFVDYMSTHSSEYKMLANKSKDINKIKIIESNISQRTSFYIPKNELTNYENKIQDGDIIGITTNIPGMDMSHVVLAYHQNGQLHFIHASLKFHKVIISSETLVEYLTNRQDATGIMVARPQ